MSEVVDLAEPIIEVREIVETFRGYAIVIEGWRETVDQAVAAINDFTAQHLEVPVALARLASELEVLLRDGWEVDRAVVDQLSADAAELLSVVVPAGVPRPDDEQSWAFSAD